MTIGSKTNLNKGSRKEAKSQGCLVGGRIILKTEMSPQRRLPLSRCVSALCALLFSQWIYYLHKLCDFFAALRENFELRMTI